MNSRIVVGVDGSAAAAKALNWAIREAATGDCVVEVVHVWDIDFGKLNFPVSVTVAEGMAWERVGFGHQQVLDAAIDGVNDNVVAVLRQGDPRTVLVEASRGASLLVIGSQGTGRASDEAVGSVCSHVVRRAACSVVVVR